MYLADRVAIPWRALQFLEAARTRAYPWQRAPGRHVQDAGRPLLRLIAMGDVALTSETLLDARRAFGPFLPLLASADVRTANLEAIPTVRSAAAGGIGSFVKAADADLAATALADAHIDVLNLANNHALDYGVDGLADAIARVRARGRITCGWRDGESVQPVLVDRRGLKTAFLGFCDEHYYWPARMPGPRPSEADPQAMEDAVREAREAADFVVVHLHWGYEFSLYPLPRHQRTARAIVDSGADLVLCHHAHVPQGLETRGRSLIAYGLGNAVMPMSPYISSGHRWTSRSALLEVEFTAGGVGSYTLHPVALAADGGMCACRRHEARELLAGLERLSRRLAQPEFLMRVGRARVAYEASRLLEALREAAAESPSALQERTLTLRVLRQRQLLAECDELFPGCRLAEALGPLAAAADDPAALADVYRRAAARLRAAADVLGKAFRWRDALSARVPN